MGQKLNPTIFRLGVNKIWKTEFFEKKNRELPLYVFKDLEIKSYIERVFEINGIIVHDYKQHYNASTLNLYISYFVTPDFRLNSNKGHDQLIIKNIKGNQCTIHKKIAKNTFLYEVLSNEIITNLSANSSKFYNIKQYLKLNSQLSTQSLSEDYRRALKNKYLKFSSNKRTTNVENFFIEIFAVLNSFLGASLNIVVNFCCLNKNVQFYKLTQKKSFVSFQKFKTTLFFQEGIELLFNVAYNSNSASLLAKFIAFQLKKVKRHKFLLSFLKQTLSVLLASSLAKVKGVKIIVKGRLNGVPRAKHKIIIIGDVPVQTISAKLDYYQVTTHNSNGSYGIKVWVVEK
jgi:Ribosomal protein S3, C-terminal domain